MKCVAVLLLLTGLSLALPVDKDLAQELLKVLQNVEQGQAEQQSIKVKGAVGGLKGLGTGLEAVNRIIDGRATAQGKSPSQDLLKALQNDDQEQAEMQFKKALPILKGGLKLANNIIDAINDDQQAKERKVSTQEMAKEQLSFSDIIDEVIEVVEIVEKVAESVEEVAEIIDKVFGEDQAKSQLSRDNLEQAKTQALLQLLTKLDN